MRADEFIVEGPLEPVPQEKRQFYRNVWRNEYVAPGELRADVDSDDDEYEEYLQSKNPFTAANQVRRMGTGAEAAVIKHDNENGVIKVIGSFQQLGQSAHLQFLLATKKYANSNPYLPRVLSANEMPSISGTNRNVHGFVVKTERLWPLGDCTKGELRLMAGKIYGKDFIPEFENYNQFAKYVKRGINGALTGSIIDPAFKQAAQMIIAVAKKMNSNYSIDALIDLHEGNLMVRRTQFGVQLVISDPLYNGGEWRNDE
jgi:hypothetical protein